MVLCASNRNSPTRNAKRCSLDITSQRGPAEEREAAWLPQEEMRPLRAPERCAARRKAVLGLRLAQAGRQSHLLGGWALAAVVSETIGALFGSCCPIRLCSRSG